MFDVLFHGADAVVPGGKFLKNCYVGVTGNKISYVGEAKPGDAARKTVNASGKVIMPGMINCHTHLPMSLLRGFADDYKLQDWLFNYIFPAESKLTGDMVYCGTQLALMECMRFGIVSVSDMYDFCGDIAKAVAESGMKANISRGTTQFEDDFNWKTSEKVKEIEHLTDEWNGFDNGRIIIEGSIHGEYTSSDKLWRPMAEYIAEKNLRVHVHVSETKKEHDECVARHGKTPVQILNDYGVWNNGGVAAHCVWIDETDMKILAEKNVSAIHNPVSNLKLASGIAPVIKMLENGVNVAFGTDGTASNNNLNFFEEMKFASITQKNSVSDPCVMPAALVVEMATACGAKAQNRNNGKLEEGCDADIIMLDFDKPHLTPCYNVFSHLVYSMVGDEVCMTMVDGKIVYENGEYLTIDREKVLFNARKSASIF